MATRQASPLPTDIHTPDEPRTASNWGINAALILTLALSVVVLIAAVLFVPHDRFSPVTRPENAGAGVRPDPRTIAPGTVGDVINKPTPELPGNKSYLQNQQVQSDTISPVGPGSFSPHRQ